MKRRLGNENPQKQEASGGFLFLSAKYANYAVKTSFPEFLASRGTGVIP
jgi:hypothetical protein